MKVPLAAITDDSFTWPLTTTKKPLGASPLWNSISPLAALRSRTWLDRSAYTYGLHGTPTTFLLEERIATLEGGCDALLVPSGLAAITLVDMALLRQGDEVLIPDNAYGPGKELARQELARWGITHRFYDPADEGRIAHDHPALAYDWSTQHK